ncbi:MAG TPA: FAD:protein FMN transferase [Dehalococcoidales bacterium]
MNKTIELSNSFRAMNTDIKAVICVPEGSRGKGERSLQKAKIMFHLLEMTFSRFLPDSELTLLNASAGRSFTATPLLFGVIAAALDAARLTDGIFDPTLLPEIIAAGYDRSFEKLSESKPENHPQSIKRNNVWQDIRLDPTESKIWLPKGCQLDLGGIAKGWSVDSVGDGFKSFTGFALDAGGDICVSGRQACGIPWTVGIANPFENEQDMKVIEVDSGCVCTSSTMKRRWQRNGAWQHHLIDPRTGKPSSSGVVSATVISSSAVLAEIIAKAALILGLEEGLNLIDRQPETSGLLVLENRQVVESSDFPAKVYA